MAHESSEDAPKTPTLVLGTNMKILDIVHLLRLTGASLNADGAVSFNEKLHKAKLFFGETSQMAAIVKDEFSLYAKGEIPTGFTGGGWGQDLTALPGAMAVGFNAVVANTLLGEIPFVRVPARTPMILTEDEVEAYWFEIGDPIPASSPSFDRQLGLSLFSMGTIITETKESNSSADPGAAMITQRALLSAFKRRINGSLLDPANAGTVGLLPPSITYGVTPVELGVYDFKEGLETLVSNFQGDLTQAYLIGKPELFVQLNGLDNPNIGARGGELAGLPAIASTSVPDDASGDYQLILVDPSGIGWAGDPTMLVDASKNAALELRDDPLGAIAPDPTPQPLISTWQMGLIALKATMFLNWKVIRPGAVSILNRIPKTQVVS